MKTPGDDVSGDSASREPDKFTINSIQELFEHGYFLHLLEKRTNELFWKRVLAWRAGILSLITVILGILGWFGFNWNSFIEKKGAELTVLEAAAKEHVAEVDRYKKQATIAEEHYKMRQQFLTDTNKALEQRYQELGARALELDKVRQQLDTALENARKRDIAAATQIERSSQNLALSEKKLSELNDKFAQFEKDIRDLGVIKHLTDEAQRARLFRMVLLHSTDAQEVTFEVPGANGKLKPVSITLRTPKIKSDDYVDLSWDIREDSKVAPVRNVVLFPGKSAAVGDASGLLLLRVEAIRKQPFARSFMILTIRARGGDESDIAPSVVSRGGESGERPGMAAH